MTNINTVDELIQNQRGKQQQQQQQPSPIKKASDAWYLLPLLFGLLGGIVMFVGLRSKDRNKGKNGLILGFVIFAIAVIFFTAVLVS